MLNERSQKVLCAIVQTYINNPEPVGSSFITKRYSFNLSPATVRNIMADLEEQGSSQPATYICPAGYPQTWVTGYL